MATMAIVIVKITRAARSLGDVADFFVVLVSVYPNDRVLLKSILHIGFSNLSWWHKFFSARLTTLTSAHLVCSLPPPAVNTDNTCVAVVFIYVLIAKDSCKNFGLLHM